MQHCFSASWVQGCPSTAGLPWLGLAWLGFPCKDILAGAETFTERFLYQHRLDTFWNSVQHSKSKYKCSLTKPECCQRKADSMSSSRGVQRKSPHLDVLGYIHFTGPHVAQAAFLQEPALVVVVGNPGGDAQPTGLGAGTPGWGVHNAVLLPGFILSLVCCGHRLTPHYPSQAALHIKHPAHCTFRPLTQIIKPQQSGSVFLWTPSSHPLCADLLVSDSPLPWAPGAKGSFLYSPSQPHTRGSLSGTPRCCHNINNYRSRSQRVEKGDEIWSHHEGLFLSPFNWFPVAESGQQSLLDGRGLGKQPQPFTGRKNSFNSSQRAQQPFEERVGSVLKAASNPSYGSVPASAKAPTALQLIGQSTGKTLIETATLILLTVIFIIILYYYLYLWLY